MTDERMLIALNPSEVAVRHEELASVFVAKSVALRDEIREEIANFRAAQRGRFKSSPFKRRIQKLMKTRTFYHKITAAIKAGYWIVPNFMMGTFAVRLDKASPRKNLAHCKWSAGFTQEPQTLAQGKGRYVSESPLLLSEPTPTEKRPDLKTYWASEFDEVAFPLIMAKPELMDATERAMSMKVFEEIGIAEDAGAGSDPMILGRIRNPIRHKPDVTLFICWAFDPTSL